MDTNYATLTNNNQTNYVSLSNKKTSGFCLLLPFFYKKGETIFQHQQLHWSNLFSFLMTSSN